MAEEKTIELGKRDTEKQSAPVTQLTPKQRETISTVQGHLEGYADSIEAFGVDGNAAEEKLWRALREDAEKLKLSAGDGTES